MRRFGGFHDDRGSQEVLSTPAPQPVPDTYKFGFAASTRLFSDVHLIRNLTVHPAAALPQLNLVKQVSQDPPLATPLTPGTEAPYEYVVTNSGNTPITDLVVSDDRVTGIDCPQNTLAVGETITCTGNYTVTAADATAGSLTNTATAQGQAGTTPVTSPPDEVTLPVQSGPGIRLEKSADDTQVYQVGDVVPYTYTVTNTGPQQLTGVGVTDNRVTGVTCNPTTLAPAGQAGDSTTCTGTYTVTQADAERGSVTNTAVATAEAGSVRSNQDQARITVEKSPCHDQHGRHCKPKPPCHDQHGRHCKPKPPCHDQHGRHCKPKPPCHDQHGRHYKPKPPCHDQHGKHCKPKPCHRKIFCPSK
ncbi:hypothetical protein [Streptomyces sp. LN785]|uniref:DUF7507 domain-containing protein n=1 Tax=Streptomyces sp. LN785 TaxID=3112983 RepID=UPI00371750BC